MRPIPQKNQVSPRTSYQQLGDSSFRGSLLFYLMSLVLFVSCGFKSEVEVSLSCGKPQDPACRKALIKSSFDDITTITTRETRPSFSWISDKQDRGS
jgi:hypothetical protein